MEELQAALAAKEATVKEQKLRTSELLREFENYRTSFNSEEQEKLKHELLLASNKIEELESALRKANKSTLSQVLFYLIFNVFFFQ